MLHHDDASEGIANMLMVPLCPNNRLHAYSTVDASIEACTAHQGSELFLLLGMCHLLQAVLTVKLNHCQHYSQDFLKSWT